VQIAITSKNASFWAVGTSSPKHVVPNLRRSLALNVDTPESLDRPVDQFSAMLGIGDIAWSQNAPPARLFDEPLRLVGVVVSIEIGDQRSASSLAKAKATARPMPESPPVSSTFLSRKRPPPRRGVIRRSCREPAVVEAETGASRISSCGTWSRRFLPKTLAPRLQFDPALPPIEIVLLCRLFGQFAESKSQKSDNCGFLSAHAFEFLGQVDAGLFCQHREQRTIDETLENRRVDVTPPANRRCISKILSDPLDRTHDRAFALRLAVDARKFSQCERGQIGRGPDPEILAVMSSPVISRR
jgi:hypothetical protein